MTTSSRLVGSGIGVAAVLTGSPLVVVVRILGHSRVWTQVRVRV